MTLGVFRGLFSYCFSFLFVLVCEDVARYSFDEDEEEEEAEEVEEVTEPSKNRDVLIEKYHVSCSQAEC